MARLPSPVTTRKTLSDSEQRAIAKAGARMMAQVNFEVLRDAVLILRDQRDSRNHYRRACGLPEV